MRTLTMILAIAMLAGCASTGRPIDQNKVAQFQVGKTTVADVRHALGEPTATVRGADGGTVLEYVHATVGPNGATFIPIVGIFAGKSTSKQEDLVLIFDAGGVLRRMSSGTGSATAGAGAG